ncbi:MAG: choice-of-anchor I family protein [Gammaproteobacteria bacterium]
MSPHNRLAVALAAAFTAGPALAAGPFTFSHLWTFNHTSANETTSFGAEIVAFDAQNERLWIAGTDANEAELGFGGVDILDLNGNRIGGFSAPSINSVAVANGLAAIAVTAPVKTDPGEVRFFDAGTFASISTVTVGANPDSVTYTPDGNRLLVANEGEPSSYLVGPSGDPEGSIGIIDTGTFAYTAATFTSFNAQAAALNAAGVRLTGPGATVAQDLEPEYIAVSSDGTKAYATLQEANSVAIVDIATATVEPIKPLGLKDHSLPGNGLDASDRDGTGSDPLNGNVQNWKIKGAYMPDGIASFSQGGTQYYVTANEGDSRADWPGGNDESRVGALADALIDPALNTALTDAHGADWKTSNDKLNRLTVTTTSDLDGDGDLDYLEAFGGRSFSILDAAGNLVFDSGDQIEQIIAADFPALWDDSRSDNKGPEPESAVMGHVAGRDLLFLGLERSNAIMVWDLTDLAAIAFLDMLFTPGDVGPEGLSFFSTLEGSFLAVANEVSETTSLYRIAPVPLPAAAWLLGSALLGLRRLAHRRA